MVIAITGILSAIVAVFIQKPIQGYFDATRRAELTDIADTAVRRLTRDLRLALPNSIRVDATGRYLEFLITTGGGRYLFGSRCHGRRQHPRLHDRGGRRVVRRDRHDADRDGRAAHRRVQPRHELHGRRCLAGDSGSNRATVASASGSTITLSAAKLFPFESPGKRFHVVDHAVTYQCDPATGVLRRYWNYGINATQVAPPSGGSSALLATRVAACTFSYEPNELLARYGTVAVRLALSADGETVNLHAQTHVSNVP